MSRRTGFLVTLLSVSLFAACGANPERAALEAYFAAGQQVGDLVLEAGNKFETLMNIQANPVAWTDAEKQEMTAITDAMTKAKEMAEAMQAPEVIADIHPLLVRSVSEMGSAMTGMSEMAATPASMSEERLNGLMESIQNGDSLISEYMTKMETTLQDKYPDLLEQMKE